jgi:PAS domain S-box-containing protein
MNPGGRTRTPESKGAPGEKRAPRTLALVPSGLAALWARAGETAPKLAFAAIVYAASLPFVGLALPSAWLAVMVALIAVGGGRGAGEHGFDPFDWLLAAGYSVAALYLVLLYGGAMQTFAVTLYGVVMFQILARDYAQPRRLWANLAPPLTSMFLVQAAAAALRIHSGRPLEIVTLLASPCIVFIAFRAVHANLVGALAGEQRAAARAGANARRTAEAHRVAIMAEDLAGIGHWRLDAVSLVFSASDGLCRILGVDRRFTAPDLETMLALFVPRDRPRVRKHVEAIVRQGIPFAFEAELVRPSGEARRVIAKGAAERDAEGALATIIGTVMDVTAMRRREEALERSEARFRMLADHSTDIVIWIGPDLAIRYVSPAIRQLGVDPDAVIGTSVLDLVHPEDRVRAGANIADLFSGAPVDHSVRREHRFLTAGGELVWLEANPTIIADDSGAPTSVVASLRDVTARRATEDDLIAAKLAAEAAGEAKSEFLANMSHEIRTPLTAILGFASLLEAMKDLPTRAATCARRIATSGATLLNIVNDILDFSKLEAGQVRLDPQPFAPARLFAEIAEAFTAQFEAKGLTLAVDIDPLVPAALEADAIRLRQIVVNLIGNAIKFTERGGVRVAVGYEAATGAGALTVAVNDTGVGIPKDKLGLLFERFSQVDGSVSRRYGGSGLGLSICRRLVDLMGGRIGVVSTFGVGSTFDFRVPAPPAAALEADGATDADEQSPTPLQCASILVVDDLDVNRELIRALLEAAGQSVTEAAGGVEAVRAALATPFDLILMDLQMPQIDGFAAARAIRAMDGPNRATPILALSADVLPEHILATGQAGMNGHIGKPIVPAELIGAVARWAAAPLADPAEAAA